MKTRWGQLAAENAGRVNDPETDWHYAFLPLRLRADQVRPDDQLDRDGERRRVVTVELGADFVRLRTVRLTRAGEHWLPAGDLQLDACSAAEILTIYPKGAR